MGSVGATKGQEPKTLEPNPNTANRQYVVKRLVKQGLGLPEAIRVYNSLSSNGFYEVEKSELSSWIRRNV